MYKFLRILQGDALYFKTLWMIFGIETGINLFFSLRKDFTVDEIETMYVSWSVFSGQKIYVDFFENHHPFFYYLLAPLIGIFKDNVMAIEAARLAVFLMLLLIFAVTYQIARNLYGKETAIISLVLLSTTQIFMFKAVEVRPDVPQTLFGLVAILFLFRFFQDKSLRDLILSSISLGASFLFLQKAVFLGAIIGGLLLMSAFSRQIKFRDIFLYSLVLILSLIPYYFYLIFNGQLHAYLINCWDANYSPFHINIKWLIDCTNIILGSFKENPFLWIFWLISFLFLGTPNQERMAVISLLLLIFYFLLMCVFTQYLMQALPLIAVMAGFAIHKVTGIFFKERSMATGALWAIVVIYILCPIHSFLNTAKHTQNPKRLQKMKYVLLNTRPADFVYDPYIKYDLFRRNIDFLGLYKDCIRYRFKTYPDINMYDLVRRYKPKVIVQDRYLNTNDHRIKAHYQRSQEYPDLYLRTK